MIECIFTLDYEIYGNGDGRLRDLVYEPSNQLRDIFKRWNSRFVNFVEVAELHKIEQYSADPDVGLVLRQVREFFEEGFEIALHLHPQWCNAQYSVGKWLLDQSEYNLCTLSKGRIEEIVGQSLAYLRKIVGHEDFKPLAFRAGNWLFQPTATAASVLAAEGIRIDSSVFKGGRQHNYGLDYRRALRNGFYWRFADDANVADEAGAWLEIPIYSQMVPFWKVRTSKRASFSKNIMGSAGRTFQQKANRVLDFLRFYHPLKFDFCRMTLMELTYMIEKVVLMDQQDPESYKPLVAIGHTKDLTDPETVNDFLSFLQTKKIPVVTFADVFAKLSRSSTSSNRTSVGQGEHSIMPVSAHA